MRTISTPLILLLILISCGDGNYLDDFDRQLLFAEPTQAELDAVRADWQARQLQPTDYQVEQSWEVIPRVMFNIVSYRVNNMKQYAMLLIPQSGEPMPVRMYLGGFGLGTITNSIVLQIDETTFEKPYLFAMPALRGQALKVTINDVGYTTRVAEGIHCDAYDGAADDGIALLNAIATNQPNVDINRVAVRGGSRGGTVALLMAERDPRIKAAIDVAGPTNLLSLTPQHENDPTYQCQFLQGLVNGSMTLAEARHRLIASSPVYFAATLPATQIHLGEKDDIVPAEQGQELKDKMDALQRGNFELFIYANKSHTDIATDNTELSARIERMLSQL